MENFTSQLFNTNDIFKRIHPPDGLKTETAYLSLTVTAILSSILFFIFRPRDRNLANKNITNVPFVGLEDGDIEIRKQKFLNEAGRLLQAGYDKVRTA